MKRHLLHLLAALLVGVLLTAVVELGSLIALFHFLPDDVDDAGFGGAAAIGLIFIIAYVGVPLFSIGAYFFFGKRVKGLENGN